MAVLPIIDDYSPRYVGDLSKPLECNFYDHNAGPVPLTGVTYASCRLLFRNRVTSVSFTGSGTWASVPSTNNNIASYTWASSDVATPGMYDIQAVIVFPDGELTFDPKPLELLARI